MRWIGRGVGLLSILLCVGLGLIWLERLNTVTVVHAFEVDNRLTAVMSNLQDAETGSRGYELTGRSEFLSPYNRALQDLDPSLNALDALTAGDARPRAAMARLRDLANRKMAEIATATALRDSVGVGAVAFGDELRCYRRRRRRSSRRLSRQRRQPHVFV